jgi:antirestriction protein ArdC
MMEYTRMGDQPCYVPGQDHILMPFQGFFKEQEAFYAITFHELGHWTGSKGSSKR